MLAQALVAQDVGAKPKRADLAEEFSPANYKGNMAALYFWRTLVSLVAGAAAGILGVYGWHGFIYHFASQIACVAPMFVTARPARRYFRTLDTLLTENAFSSTTLLSFIFFWMLMYNLCHVF